MLLANILQMIPALPWRNAGTVVLAEENTRVTATGNPNLDAAQQKQKDIAGAIYIQHAANHLPRLLEAFEKLLEVQRVSGTQTTADSEEWFRRIHAARKAVHAAKEVDTQRKQVTRSDQNDDRIETAQTVSSIDSGKMVAEFFQHNEKSGNPAASRS